MTNILKKLEIITIRKKGLQGTVNYHDDSGHKDNGKHTFN